MATGLIWAATTGLVVSEATKDKSVINIIEARVERAVSLYFLEMGSSLPATVTVSGVERVASALFTRNALWILTNSWPRRFSHWVIGVRLR